MMKRKIFSGLLAAAMTIAVMAGCGNTGSSTDNSNSDPVMEQTEKNQSSETAEVSDFDGLTADYEPNADYDKYAITEYTYEELGETCIVLVSANEDETKFECHFIFFGDEQLAEVSYDGGTYNVDYDKTGFVTKEVPVICEQLVKAGKWAQIN